MRVWSIGSSHVGSETTKSRFPRIGASALSFAMRAASFALTTDRDDPLLL